MNKDEFLYRISHQFNTNDPQARITSLKLLTYCPLLLQNRLDIQHQILYLLTTNTVKDPKERQIANTTVQQIAANSEAFAKSIMVKVEEAVLSGNYDVSTCQNLVKVISNVPGDSNCALLFFDAIVKISNNLQGTELLDGLVLHLFRALLRMTIKVPLLFDCVFEFLTQEACSLYSPDLCSEGLYVLSRAYNFSEE